MYDAPDNVAGAFQAMYVCMYLRIVGSSVHVPTPSEHMPGEYIHRYMPGEYIHRYMPGEIHTAQHNIT